MAAERHHSVTFRPASGLSGLGTVRDSGVWNDPGSSPGKAPSRRADFGSRRLWRRAPVPRMRPTVTRWLHSGYKSAFLMTGKRPRHDHPFRPRACADGFESHDAGTALLHPFPKGTHVQKLTT